MPATATIEERVTYLEHEVRYLKAFAGPGQNEALSANVAEIRVIVTDLKKQFDRLEQRVETRLDGFGTRLDGFGTQLKKFETRLDQVETRLEGFATQLSGVSAHLGEHTKLLAEILSRLPRPATPGDN
ncbi:MAG TPA: hypothetical protein VMU95_02610 [Trebonia sp.]|nr:hypothetical protein [Trebonia sp.]